MELDPTPPSVSDEIKDLDLELRVFPMRGLERLSFLLDAVHSSSGLTKQEHQPQPRQPLDSLLGISYLPVPHPPGKHPETGVWKQLQTAVSAMQQLALASPLAVSCLERILDLILAWYEPNNSALLSLAHQILSPQLDAWIEMKLPAMVEKSSWIDVYHEKSNCWVPGCVLADGQLKFLCDGEFCLVKDDKRLPTVALGQGSKHPHSKDRVDIYRALMNSASETSYGWWCPAEILNVIPAMPEDTSRIEIQIHPDFVDRGPSVQSLTLSEFRKRFAYAGTFQNFYGVPLYQSAGPTDLLVPWNLNSPIYNFSSKTRVLQPLSRKKMAWAFLSPPTVALKKQTPNPPQPSPTLQPKIDNYIQSLLSSSASMSTPPAPSSAPSAPSASSPSPSLQPKFDNYIQSLLSSPPPVYNSTQVKLERKNFIDHGKWPQKLTDNSINSLRDQIESLENVEKNPIESSYFPPPPSNCQLLVYLIEYFGQRGGFELMFSGITSGRGDGSQIALRFSGITSGRGDGSQIALRFSGITSGRGDGSQIALRFSESKKNRKPPVASFSEALLWLNWLDKNADYFSSAAKIYCFPTWIHRVCSVLLSTLSHKTIEECWISDQCRLVKTVGFQLQHLCYLVHPREDIPNRLRHSCQTFLCLILLHRLSTFWTTDVSRVVIDFFLD